MRTKSIYLLLLILYPFTFVLAQKKTTKRSTYQEWFSVGYGYTYKISKNDFLGNTFGPSFSIKPRNANYMHHFGLQYSKSYSNTSVLAIDYGLGVPYFLSDKYILWYSGSLAVLRAEPSTTYVGFTAKAGASWVFTQGAGIGLELSSCFNAYHPMHAVKVVFILK